MAEDTKPDTPPAVTAPEGPKPNVKFVGTRDVHGKEERMTEAPATVRNGGTVIKLPDSETQLAGFYHEKAAELCRAFPGLYKPINQK